MKKYINKLFGYLWKITCKSEEEIIKEVTRKKLSDEKAPAEFDWKFEFDGKKELDNIARDILSKEMSLGSVEVDKHGTHRGKLSDNAIRSILCDWNELHKLYERDVRRAYKKGVERTISVFKD